MPRILNSIPECRLAVTAKIITTIKLLSDLVMWPFNYNTQHEDTDPQNTYR